MPDFDNASTAVQPTIIPAPVPAGYVSPGDAADLARLRAEERARSAARITALEDETKTLKARLDELEATAVKKPATGAVGDGAGAGDDAAKGVKGGKPVAAGAGNGAGAPRPKSSWL